MRVLYDHQVFDLQTHGGISNGFVQQISHFPASTQYQLGIKRTNNVHLLESGLSHVKPFLCTPETFLTKRHFPGKSLLYGVLSQRILQLRPWDLNSAYSLQLLKEGNYDVFHPTYFLWYFLDYLNGKPFVLTIHDLTPEHFFNDPTDEQIQARKLLIDKAAHVITVSEYTRQDVMDYYHVPESKISVVYWGGPAPVAYSKIKRYDFDYMLYVGSRTASYKNFIPMLRHLQPFFQNHPEIKLICTGNGFNENEIAEINRLGIVHQVINQFCSQEELMNLYAHALCFIYPSMNEGFGIPILEAYAAGCPVFLNHKSCFPEIAADAAVYFHLDDKDGDLLDQLVSFLQETPEQKKRLLDKQKERLSYFSWDKSVADLLKVYQLVGNS